MTTNPKLRDNQNIIRDIELRDEGFFLYLNLVLSVIQLFALRYCIQSTIEHFQPAIAIQLSVNTNLLAIHRRPPALIHLLDNKHRNSNETDLHYIFIQFNCYCYVQRVL